MTRTGAAAFVAAVGVVGLACAACSSESGSSSSSETASTAPVATGQASTADAEVTSTIATAVTEPSEPAVTDAVAGSVAVDGSVADTVPAVLPEGFTTVLVEVTKADGSTCEVCMWLADDPTERGQGLMGVTDLGAADGMAFVWDEPTNGAFFMFQTVTPLSIAWFGPPDETGSGAFVSSTDMEPCLSDDAATCERFPAGGEYQLAVEVFAGDLASIGITDGSRAEVLEGSEAADCPVA